jgi:hypothetical protein
MRTEAEYEDMAVLAYRLACLLDRISEPETITPVVLSVLTMWCNKYGVDIEQLVALMMETIADKNGIEIETEGE